MSEGAAKGERQKLLDEFDAVVAETEQLLKSIGGGEGELSASMKAKLQQNLKDAKERLLHLEETVVKHTRDAARAADDYVQENPWRAVGIAAGVGFLIGILLSRR